MSTNIDTNIVQMKFDNEQFEKKCAQSMSTLDKLKAKINESNSVKGLSSLGESANSINLGNIEKSVNAVADRFTFLGNLAFKIKDKIADAFLGLAKTIATTVPNIIKQGGWERAMNIEKAKFQLEGLHVAWNQIEKDISYAVDGTAYGLDAAAKAASQLVASGVAVGDSMKTALRGISGVAAMTQSQYEEISPIFTTVAGQGKVMTMQLRQLENRGLNAAAIMADQFNAINDGSVEASDSVKKYVSELTGNMKVSEAVIREMVSDGKINFEVFSTAMDNAFGEHAKDANKTFEGVTANIRAALKKIGADFATPIITEEGPVVKALQQLRLRINDVRSALKPLNDVWVNFINEYAKGAEQLLKNLDMGFMTDIAYAAARAFVALEHVIKPVIYAFKDILSISTTGGLKSLSASLAEFSKKLILSKTEMENLRATVRGILSVFSIFATIIKQVLAALLGLTPETINLREEILKITGKIGNLLTYISLVVKKIDIVGPAIKGIKLVLELLVITIASVIVKIAEFIRYIKNLEVTQKIIDGVSDALYLLIGGIVLLISKIKDLVSVIKSGNFESLGIIGDTIIFVKTGILSLVDAISQLGLVQDIILKVTSIFEKFKKTVDELFGNNKDVNANVSSAIVTIKDAQTPLAKFGDTLEEAGESAEKMSTGVGGIIETLKTFINTVPVSQILAVGFAVALAYGLTRITNALYNFSEGYRKAGSFLMTLSKNGLVGMILGTGGTTHKPNLLLDMGAAIGVLALSLYKLAEVPSDKLEAAANAMFKIGGTYVGMLALLTALDKWFNFSASIQTIVESMIMLSGAITILAAAFTMLTYADYSNADKAGIALASIAGAVTLIGIVISKFGDNFRKTGLAFISFSASMLILVSALNKLKEVVDFDLGPMMSKLIAFGILALEMLGIAKVADYLGGKSFMRLAISALSLAAAIKIFIEIQDALPDDLPQRVADFVNQLTEVSKKVIVIIGIVTAFAIAITTIISILAIIKEGFGSILNKIKQITAAKSKIRTHIDDHKKALDKLALAALVTSVTISIAALSAVVVALTKADLLSNWPAFAAGMAVIVTMFAGMILMIKQVGNNLKGIKVAPFLSLLLTFQGLILTVAGVSAVIYVAMNDIIQAIKDKNWEKLGKIGAMFAALGVAIAAVVGGIVFITSQMSKLKGLNFNKTTMGGIIAIISSIAVIAGSIAGLAYSVNKNGIVNSIASMAILAIAVGGLTTLFTALANCMKNNKLSKETVQTLGILVTSVAVIAGSLVALSVLPDNMGDLMTAFTTLSIIFGELGGIAYLISKIDWDTGNTTAVMAMIAMLGTIAFSLVEVTQNMKDSQSIISAMVAMSAVMATFSAMTYVLSKGDYDLSIWNAFLGIIVTSVAIGAALTLFSNSMQDPVGAIAAAGAMSIVMATFSAMTLLLSKGNFGLDLWIAVVGIVGAAVGIAYSLSLLAGYSWGEILPATVGLSTVMIAFSAMTVVLGKAGIAQAVVGMIAMVGLAIAAVEFAEAIKTIGDMPWYDILQGVLGLVAVGAAFGAMAIVAGTFAESLIGMVTLIGVGAAAMLFAKAIEPVGEMAWYDILQGVLGLTAVGAAFGAMAIVAGTFAESLIGMITLIGVGAAAIEFANAISTIANYDWQSILAATLSLVSTMALFSGAAILLGTLAPVTAIGAGVLLLISAAAVPFAYGLKIAAEAMDIFSTALSRILPIAQVFFVTILTTIVSMKDSLAEAGAGLVVVAAGLSALGLAGAVLATGSAGLLAGGVALPIIANGLEQLEKIDFKSINSGLVDFIKSAAELAVSGQLLLAGAPGLLAGAVALTTYSLAVKNATTVLSKDIIAELEKVPPKAKEIGKWVTVSLKNGISDSTSVRDAIDAAKKVAKGIENIIRDTLDIHSNSPMLNKIGEWVAKSVGIGIEKESDGTINITKTMVNGITNKLTDGATSAGIAGMLTGKSYGNGLDSALTQVEQMTGIHLSNISDMFGKMSSFSTEHGYGGMPSDVVEQLSNVTNASNSAAEGLDNYGGAASEAGGKSKAASEDVKDLSSAFNTVERGSKVSLDTMINNLADNYKETVLWAKDMKELMGRGFDKSITDMIKKMGVGGRETIKAFMSASEEQIPVLNALSKRMLTLDEDAKKYIEGDYEAFAQDIGNILEQGVTAWNSQLEKTIQDALDPFGEFDAKTEMTSNQMLANMNSQLKGIRTWGDNMAVLMDRNVNENILAYLAELGPKGYEYVNAMVNMTDEQLNEMSNLWEQQERIGAEISNKLSAKALETGTNVAQGVIDGLADKAGDVKTQTDKTFNNNMMKHLEKDICETASPSKRTYRLANNLIQGLVTGLQLQQLPLHRMVQQVAEYAFRVAEDNMGFEPGRWLGGSMCSGLIAGLNAGSNAVTRAAEKVAIDAYNAAKRAIESSSPSKKFMQLGKWADEGFAIGISKNAGEVINSVSDLGMSAVDQMSKVISEIANNVNGEFEDISPVITPRLNLEELQNEKSLINSMFGGTSIDMANRIMADQNNNSINSIPEGTVSTTNNQTIIFNQTNNSPKAINAYESYRLNRLALLQMKGALT